MKKIQFEKWILDPHASEWDEYVIQDSPKNPNWIQQALASATVLKAEFQLFRLTDVFLNLKKIFIYRCVVAIPFSNCAEVLGIEALQCSISY